MLISLIVPCYNEEAVIQESYRRLSKVMLSIHDHQYEIIFINDGSKDKTREMLNLIASTDTNVKLIHFSRNFGHQPAATAGINNCNGDLAVIIDADLQDPPEIIPEMIKMLIDNECNVVYGVRNQRKGESFFKKITAKIFYRVLNKLSDIEIPKDSGDFRLIDRKIIDNYNNLKENNKYIRGLIYWLGFKQMPIFYNRDARFAGETKYPLRKMLKFASIGLFYFSKKPLKMATSLGFISICVGIVFSIWILINKFANPQFLIDGWSSLMLIIIFFGGVQLLTIGVLGQYIGSLFDEVKARPEYIIETKSNF
jgi:glycosyltransferase involved in cell wall biosynthesis